jgi:hypothetical protein
VIAWVAEEAEEVPAAASDLNDILTDEAVAADDPIGHSLRILSITRRVCQCILVLSIIVDPSLIECRVNHMTAIGAVVE